MGLFSQAGSHIKRARGSSVVDDRAPEDTEPDDTSILFVVRHLSLILLYRSMIIQDADPPYRDENEGSVILSLISQLRYAVYVICKVRSRSDTRIAPRVGMDLSKVTFPTFVLEPRSMLERITDFMSHPDLIFGSV